MLKDAASNQANTAKVITIDYLKKLLETGIIGKNL
jgi:hypothetical protein